MELNKENLERFQAEMKRLNELKQELKDKKEAFEFENKDLIELIENSSETINNLKSTLTENAINDFRETGQKKLLGGLGIRQGISLKYDEKFAFDWAKEHDLCLQLNKKEFEKLAKTQDISGVTKEEKITVTFPKEIVFD